MNRIVTVLALVACLFAGLFTLTPAHAQSTHSKAAQNCSKCATKKAARAKTVTHAAKKGGSCCTSGSCCSECPTCCANGTCNTGKCPKGCCDMSKCLPGTACCN